MATTQQTSAAGQNNNALAPPSVEGLTESLRSNILAECFGNYKFNVQQDVKITPSLNEQIKVSGKGDNNATSRLDSILNYNIQQTGQIWMTINHSLSSALVLE